MEEIKDARTVRKYSGHKSLESFSVYVHPTGNGRILATQAMENVGRILAAFSGNQGNEGTQGGSPAASNRLNIKEVAVS